MKLFQRRYGELKFRKNELGNVLIENAEAKQYVWLTYREEQIALRDWLDEVLKTAD